MFNSLESLPQLYRLPPSARQFFWDAVPAIASVAGGVLGAVGSLFGGGTPDIDSQRQQAALQAAWQMRKAYKEAAKYLKPWREQGKSSLGLYGGLMNLPDYTPIDRTAYLEQTPGYQFLTDQGIKGLSRYGAATGLAASGPAMKGALQFSQGLAQSQAWRPYVEDVWRSAEAGRGASTQTGNWALQAAGAMGQNYMAAAQANAGAQMQEANAQAAARQNQISGLFGSLGLGLGGLSQLGGLGGGGTSSYTPISVGSGVWSPYVPAPSSWSSPTTGSWGFNTGIAPMYNPFSGNMMSYNPYSGSVMDYKMMAGGGRINPNEVALVGENGPELFVPQRSGFIIPNYLLRYSAFDDYLKAA